MSVEEEKKVKYQSLAEESSKTKKVREKLKKHLEEIDKQMTKSALERKSIEIQRWLSRHSDQRIVLHPRNIVVYKEGKVSAKLGKKLAPLIERLKQDAKAHFGVIDTSLTPKS